MHGDFIVENPKQCNASLSVPCDGCPSPESLSERDVAVSFPRDQFKMSPAATESHQGAAMATVMTTATVTYMVMTLASAAVAATDPQIGTLRFGLLNEWGSDMFEVLSKAAVETQLLVLSS